MLVQWVEVSSNCSLKHCRVLGDDAKPWSEIMKAYLGNVHTINDNTPFSGLNDPENGLYECWFSTSSPSYNSNLHPSRKCAANVFENRWEVFSITDLQHGEICMLVQYGQKFSNVYGLINIKMHLQVLILILLMLKPHGRIIPANSGSKLFQLGASYFLVCTLQSLEVLHF